MDKERAIIARFANALNGDDGAVLSSRTSRASVNSSLCAKSVSNLNCAGGAIGENIAISKDLFIEDVHFRRSWLTPYQIGAKAAIVNISDAIAMNASPKYALFGLGVPRNMSQKDISALCDGVRETLESYGASVVGGDTVASDKITISLTIISNLNARRALERGGAKLGDVVFFTGSLGGSLKGLRAVLNGGRIARNSRFARPVLREEFVKKAAKYLSAGMDISDGLASDLPKLLAGRALKYKKKLSKFEIISGEEYEMLCACSPRVFARVRAVARQTRTPLTQIGKIIKGRCEIHGKFSHF
jgi:thiamine-monophosphate kinase